MNAEKIKDLSDELITCEKQYHDLVNIAQPWAISVSSRYPTKAVCLKLSEPIYNALRERIEELKESLRKAVK